MKGYELCIIFQPDASDAVMDELLSALGGSVAKYNGSVLKTEKWGKRNLKYAIKKHTKGNFCFVFFTGTAETLKDIDRVVRYNEQIMRYTVIKLDKNFIPVVVESATSAAAAAGDPEAPAEAVEPATQTTAEA
ncbi:MAG: 30S ribosomal protein S6 [Proteobacteria bacterium]|nr:30S ribosomal protein S6 [Pseudomonadota bacterium]